MEKRWIIPIICLGLTILLSYHIIAEEQVVNCSPEVNLPDEIIQFLVIDGDESYFDIKINTPQEDLKQGPYHGWCVEKNEQMSRNVNHTAHVYSSYDETMPPFFQGVGGIELWHKINFLLNNIDYIISEIGNESCSVNKNDIQDTIWNICCGISYDNVTPCAQLIIDYLSNETNQEEIYSFCPQIGDVLVVLIDTQSDDVHVQHTILELPILEHEEEEEENDPPSNPSRPGGIVLSGNAPPTADGSKAKPYQGVIDETITFDGSLSYDSDGEIVQWHWDFGDGSDGVGEIVTHVYSQSGTYSVILQVTDDEGSTDSYQTSVEVFQPNRAPEMPDFNGETYCEISENYIYKALTTDPDNDTIKYIFEWGDGGSNTETSFVQNNSTVTINKIWNEAGLFLLKVFAKDELNVPSDTYQTYVYVDVDVIFINDQLRGYLLDYGRDGTYDIYHDNETGEDVSVGINDEGMILIDNDDDGKWNWFYGGTVGLQSYSSSSDNNQDSSLPFEYIVLIGIIISIAIIVLVLIIRRR
jgi:PKD repeat protein